VDTFDVVAQSSTMKARYELRRVVAVAMLLSMGLTKAWADPDKKPSTDKATTASKLDAALAKAKETPITVSEGSTAGAIRGITAAPGSPQGFGLVVKRGIL